MDKLTEKAKEFETAKDYFGVAEVYKTAYKKTGQEYLIVKIGEAYKLAGDIKNALIWYEKLKNCRNEVLENNLIDFYLNVKLYKRACDEFTLSFPNASARAKMDFADKLYAKKQYEMAIDWYDSCCDKTLFSRKNAYISKIGDNAFFDDKEILSVYQKTIERGDEAFFSGKYKFAASCYAKCAEKGVIYAKIKYAESLFLANDFKKAEKAFRDLFEIFPDDAEVMFMLGECYNAEPLETNSQENAYYWYEFALEKGCKKVYYHLGLCYQFGLGCDIDEEKALEMYKLGANENYDKANCLCKIGNMYYDRKEYKKAVEYFDKAAKCENVFALVNLALCYFNGVAEGYEYEQIICLLLKAAAFGSQRADEMLKEISLADDEESEDSKDNNLKHN